MKKNPKDALRQSLIKESASIDQRFELAETLFNDKTKSEVIKNDPKENVQNRAIRDSFTMLATDFALIMEIKKRAMINGIDTNKSEILRAGILALNEMDKSEFQAILEKVEKLKPGRPK